MFENDISPAVDVSFCRVRVVILSEDESQDLLVRNGRVNEIARTQG